MKTILKSFGTFLGVMFLFYLLGAFGQANFNIVLWSEDARGFVSFTGGFISLVAMVAAIIYDKIDNI